MHSPLTFLVRINLLLNGENYGCSPHVSVGEKSLLECVIINESLSVELDFSLRVNATTEEFIIIYHKRTIVATLRHLAALSG